MGIMSVEQQKWCRKDFTDQIRILAETMNLTKSDIDAAVSYTDDWITNNDTDYKSGLPEPFKTKTTVSQKVRLFMVVAAHIFLAS